MKTSRIAALVATVALTGCMSLSDEDAHFYALYQSDASAPRLNPSHRSPGLCAFMSFLIPGLGHLYMWEPGWAIFWIVMDPLTLGIGPAVAAYDDAEVSNQERAARAYKSYWETKQKVAGR